MVEFHWTPDLTRLAKENQEYQSWEVIKPVDMQKAVRIISGFADGFHPKYIEGFPILPEGEYEISAAMSRYRAIYDDFDGYYDGLDDWDYLTIHYPNQT